MSAALSPWGIFREIGSLRNFWLYAAKIVFFDHGKDEYNFIFDIPSETMDISFTITNNVSYTVNISMWVLCTSDSKE
jgi:hypothetical protein